MSDSLIYSKIRSETACYLRATGKRGGNIGIAVESCDLLCYIAHKVDVLTEGRCCNCEAVSVCTDLGLKFDALKVLLHLLCCKVEADEMIDFGSLALNY